MLLIPAIDLFQGRCIRLRQGDFSQEMHYTPTPASLLGWYQALGASWVHVVDLAGARDGRAAQHALLASLAGLTSTSLQAGGGVRSAAAIEALLSAGVSRVVIGSIAIVRPAEVLKWLKRFGPERICLAFDVRSDEGSEPMVRTQGWTQASGINLWQALAPYSTGARHILCTDIGRDGTLEGPNVELYRSALRRFPHLAWQASGGIGTAADLKTLEETGVTAAIAGRALLEDRIPPEELKPFWPDASSRASTCATGTS